MVSAYASTIAIATVAVVATRPVTSRHTLVAMAKGKVVCQVVGGKEGTQWDKGKGETGKGGDDWDGQSHDLGKAGGQQQQQKRTIEKPSSLQYGPAGAIVCQVVTV